MFMNKDETKQLKRTLYALEEATNQRQAEAELLSAIATNGWSMSASSRSVAEAATNWLSSMPNLSHNATKSPQSCHPNSTGLAFSYVAKTNYHDLSYKLLHDFMVAASTTKKADQSTLNCIARGMRVLCASTF